jgi:hypothetical protein
MGKKHCNPDGTAPCPYKHCQEMLDACLLDRQITMGALYMRVKIIARVGVASTLQLYRLIGHVESSERPTSTVIP